MEDRGAVPVKDLMDQIKIIPVYQRDFVWSTNELTKFFEDLNEEWQDNTKHFSEKKYFIGLIYSVINAKIMIPLLFLHFFSMIRVTVVA